jgi:hypothetical protein
MTSSGPLPFGEAFIETRDHVFGTSTEVGPNVELTGETELPAFPAAIARFHADLEKTG